MYLLDSGPPNPNYVLKFLGRVQKYLHLLDSSIQEGHRIPTKFRNICIFQRAVSRKATDLPDSNIWEGHRIPTKFRNLLEECRNICTFQTAVSGKATESLVLVSASGGCRSAGNRVYHFKPKDEEEYVPLIKKKTKFSSYIRKFRWEQLQSHI